MSSVVGHPEFTATAERAASLESKLNKPDPGWPDARYTCTPVPIMVRDPYGGPDVLAGWDVEITQAGTGLHYRQKWGLTYS